MKTLTDAEIEKLRKALELGQRACLDIVYSDEVGPINEALQILASLPSALESESSPHVGAEPVAYMNADGTMAAGAKVYELMRKATPAKADRYMIPLYTQPTPQQTAPVTEAKSLSVPDDHIGDVNKMVPDGWQLVPKMATDEMLDAGVAMALQVTVQGQGGWSRYISELYAQLLAGAPTPPLNTQDQCQHQFVQSNLSNDRRARCLKCGEYQAAKPDPRIAETMLKVARGELPSPTTLNTQDGVDEEAEFKKWCASKGYPPTVGDWEVWQARSNLSKNTLTRSDT